MGCPPDPVEVSIWRSGERISGLEAKYHRLIDEWNEAQAAATRLVPGFAPEIKAHHKEKFTLRTDVPPCEDEPYAHESAQWRLESAYEKQVKTLEMKLCALRTQLISDAAQRSLHLSHRNEDRAQWVKWLEQRIQVLEFHLGDKNPESGPRIDVDKTRQMLKAIRAEVTRLEKIDDETLLSDQGILQVDENRWMTPYLD